MGRCDAWVLDARSRFCSCVDMEWCAFVKFSIGKCPDDILDATIFLHKRLLLFPEAVVMEPVQT